MTYTTEEIDKIGSELLDQRDAVNEIDEIYKVQAEALSILNQKMIAILQEIGKDKWVIEGRGTISIVNKFTYRLPTPENVDAFISYLEQKGVDKALRKINSQALNAWANEEMKSALERGDVDFKIPLLDEPKLVQTIRVNKAK